MSTSEAELKNLSGLLYPYFDMADVVEISGNPSGDVFVERFGSAPEHIGVISSTQVDIFLRYCARVADLFVSEADPILSTRVPLRAHRLEGLMPPIVARPTFSIRRHSDHVIELDSFVDDPDVAGIIRGAISDRQNIVIAGGTSSGKTTLLNSCLAYLSQHQPDTRLIVLEDTPELQVALQNTVQMCAGPAASLERLLVSSLRLSPDRIVLGEVRTGVVLMTLLKSWNTGHPGGLTSIHANSAGDTVARMQMLASEVTASDQSGFINQAVDLIVFLARDLDAPKVRQILRLNSSNEMEFIYNV